MQYYKPQAVGSMGVGRGPVGGSSSNDLTTPIIQNITPADGSEQQDSTTPITFDIFDYGDNVNRSTILVMVNGEMVLSGDTFYLGWTGSVTKQDFGYHVHLNPNFTGRGRKVVTVDAHVKDETGLLVCAEWSYVTFVIPNTLRVVGLSGPLDGGTIVKILGSGVSNRKYVEDFAGGISSKWTRLNTTQSSSGLIFNVVNDASVRSITSTYSAYVLDYTLSYVSTAKSNAAFYGTSTLCSMRIEVSSDTYCQVSNVINSDIGSYAHACAYQNGILVSESINRYAVPGQLRIRRNAGYVEMYSGSVLVSSFNGWSAEPSRVVIGASTNGIGFVTTLLKFVPRVVVLFDNQIADAVNEYQSSMIIAQSPRYKLPRQVPMHMYSLDRDMLLPYGFTYIEPPRLTVSNDGDVMKIENDSTLRDVSDALPGLRL